MEKSSGVKCLMIIIQINMQEIHVWTIKIKALLPLQQKVRAI